MRTAALQQFNSRRHYWKRNIAFWVLGLLVCLFVLAVLSEFGYRRSFERLYLQTKINTEDELEKQSLLLESYLEKYRLLPVLLAKQSRVVEEATLENLDSLKTWLQQLSYLSGSHDVILLDQRGRILLSARYESAYYPDFADSELVVAPGQARLGRGFIQVGEDSALYGFSTEIRLADNEPLIFAFIVNLGVVNQSWALSDTVIVAVDHRQEVTITSHEPLIDDASVWSYLNNANYVSVQKKVNSMGWTIYAFQFLDLAPLRERTLLTGLLFSLAMFSFLAFFIRRREKILKQNLYDKLYAQELESQINFRTAELVSSNRCLSDEINERKLAEKHLKLKHKELVHSAKLATIGQMSATLSHEYNQPLAATRTYAENAIRFLDLGKLEPVRENLQRIMQQADRMGQLSRTLLSFSGKPDQPMSAIDVSVAVQEAIMLVTPRLKKAKARVEKRLDSSLMLRGHPMQFSQVLVNLMTNAADAVASKQVNNGLIRLGIVRHGSVALISVDDNGTGLKGDIEKSLFEPFSSTKSHGQGLGLGLSIIKDIVHDHQGTISFHQSDLGGVCFQIEWPLWSSLAGKTNEPN
jgi:two-component system C4-dicarboxylate transport sensor histidine kinase DctB